MTKIVPINVAAPFPPLNEKYIGKTCPKTTENAQQIGSINESGDRELAIITGDAPFKISKKNTNKPYFFPNALTVLVAPAFPLPIFRISTFLRRHIIILAEIDPNR